VDSKELAIIAAALVAAAYMVARWTMQASDQQAALDAPPADSAAIYMRELERVVREHPAQYLWVHRRFKTRPPGEPSVYD